MSVISDLKEMQKLVDVKYRQQQESFARLLIQEDSLRKSLLRVDEHLADSRCNADADQKEIGADILWQAWLGRKKKELNMHLAKVLATKEQHIEQVRKAYGKVRITNALLSDESKKAKQKREKIQLDRTLDSAAAQHFKGAFRPC
ncbi:hypothetical protein GGR95_001650 [Sulfitobacter undariae]|uniref:Flagellar FliJ protein n=1 Tax=Sulfitobacter undariae TaxID=1563671 RepID=A0A7W6H1Q8_9RHOB|nr:hypothetical protein [Sulfitobacter undariae]MBB3994009.1 hypothetical protein [Sulfitobacter undariae]